MRGSPAVPSPRLALLLLPVLPLLLWLPETRPGEEWRGARGRVCARAGWRWGSAAAAAAAAPPPPPTPPAFSLGTPEGSAGTLQCHGVAPLGDLNCSWEPRGDRATPFLLHLQSHYHPSRTYTVAVAAGQHWVTVPREELTASDKLRVWGSGAGRPLGPPISVNLDTRVKPNVPQLWPDVDFSEGEPLDATVHWAAPTWPSHKVLICQFRYQKCLEQDWVLLEPELETIPLSPLEIQDLELATSYRVSGRCRTQDEEDLWGEWSPSLSFQTLPSGGTSGLDPHIPCAQESVSLIHSTTTTTTTLFLFFLAPKDVWVSGNLCGTPGAQDPLLLWTPPGSCLPVSYRVWFPEQEPPGEGVACCSVRIPAGAQWAAVSAVNATSWKPLTNLSLACLDSAPRGVVVSSAGSGELRVSWRPPGSGEPQEYVVDWARDGEPLEKLTWARLPPRRLSALLAGNFTEGVPYRITVTAVSPGGVAPAPPVWGFTQELAPVIGPALWRLRDDPPGTPAVAWAVVPRHQLRGHLTHYTVCARSGGRPSVCVNVNGSIWNITLPDLPRGPCELWVTASTTAGQGPPGPSLWLHLPDNSLGWKVLPGVLSLWGLFFVGCGLALTLSGRCLHLRYKVLPRWLWEKVPDPANSQSGQPPTEEVPPVQPPGDLAILEVEEMQPPPAPEPPQAAAAPLDCGYERHFLPTPEELGLLSVPHPGALDAPGCRDLQ
nr:interleukin-27 receptor subunit alpha isoform X1 [Oryctolagus cuniculus]XP_051691768.1 interleukin-27 receptor subunit alpha isoform X1 [Oryctolagus cuniculus]XP_051691769.1 interleukin-27 receptor subunit alpha isoform X1 [Oryctolagus cuniculus]XP_051691770.1 interleukin-27 receptor subunit alpha isoform X1 [Oryctolagus cuniculus]